MSAPTEFSEADLATYSHVTLGGLADSLSFTVEGGSYDRVIAAALLEYGVETVDEIEGLRQVAHLLACIRYHLWNYVAHVTVGKFDLSDAGSSLSLSQIHTHARACAKDELAEVQRTRSDLEYYTGETASGDTVLAIRVYDVSRDDDPLEAYEEYEDDADGVEYSE